jgi:hypothetical protein
MGEECAEGEARLRLHRERKIVERGVGIRIVLVGDELFRREQCFSRRRVDLR